MSGETDPNVPIRLTVGALRMVIGDIAQATKAHVIEEIAKAVAPLERRIAELEAREYQGAWAGDKSYPAGASVTSSGNLWIARSPSIGMKPGTNPCWQLAVRRGKAGKDGSHVR